MPRKPPKLLPSQDELRSILDYNAKTGVLSWKRRPEFSRADIGFNNKAAGKVAGTVTGRADSKYVHIGIDGVYYGAHRIIWKMMTGEEPPDFIDHRDGDRLNNRWVNFRPADNGTNLQNAKLRKDNKSGIKGVFWESSRKKWVAVITVNGTSRRLGRFASIAAAKQAITEARDKLHGEFARHS